MYDTENFKVILDFNGEGVAILNKKNDSSIYFQGDDAAEILDEIEEIQEKFPNRNIDTILADIWFNYNY